MLLVTDSALASHLHLWSDQTFQIKLVLVGLIALLVVWHMRQPRLHALEARSSSARSLSFGSGCIWRTAIAEAMSLQLTSYANRSIWEHMFVCAFAPVRYKRQASAMRGQSYPEGFARESALEVEP